MSGETHELLNDHHSPHGPLVTQIRGSLIVSSRQTLRELGLYERYLGCLPADRHEQVLFRSAIYARIRKATDDSLVIDVSWV